jgi:hypothetical protein
VVGAAAADVAGVDAATVGADTFVEAAVDDVAELLEQALIEASATTVPTVPTRMKVRIVPLRELNHRAPAGNEQRNRRA